MTEILTESFCERCGTRYTFEPVASKRRPLSAIGTLGRGIRHFVSDPGTSLDEAFAVARSEREQRSTASALEAFHRTFNFCLSCRQYTCADCWNAVEGRCLTCAPTADAAPPETRHDHKVDLRPVDLAPAPAPSMATTAEPVAIDEVAQADAEAAAAVEAAEMEAVAAEAAAAEAAEAAAEAERVAAEQAAAEQAAAEAARQAEEARLAEEARVAEEARLEAEAETARSVALAEEAAREAAAEAARAAAELADAEAAAAAAQAEAEARAEAERRTAEEAAAFAFTPGLNLDDQIAAYERQQAAGAASDVLAPAPAGDDRVAEVEDDAIDAQVAARLAALAPPESDTEPAPEPDTEPQPEDEAMQEQVAARLAEFATPRELDYEPIPTRVEPIPTAIGQPLPASAADGALSWPDSHIAVAAFEPSWPEEAMPRKTTGAGLPAAAAPQAPQAAHACPSCGLSLSASARFCRRCGTPQQIADSPV